MRTAVFFVEARTARRAVALAPTTATRVFLTARTFVVACFAIALRCAILILTVAPIGVWPWAQFALGLSVCTKGPTSMATLVTILTCGTRFAVAVTDGGLEATC